VLELVNNLVILVSFLVWCRRQVWRLSGSRTMSIQHCRARANTPTVCCWLHSVL